jgi:uncharacterized integral membrane protein
MNDLWLKIKAWTKGIVAILILLYVILFTYNNSGESVKFWWWFNHTHPTSVFLLAACAFLAGIIFTLLVRTLWGTWRQVRGIRTRSKTDRIERDLADMKAKAAMLQTKPPGNGPKPEP